MPMKKDYRELIKIKVIVIIIIAGIIISGCISGENSRIQAQTTPMKSTAELPSKTPVASPINQESDVKTSQLIPNPDEVLGFTLKHYEFFAIPQNSSSDRYTETTSYKDVLPIGYRNIGQTSGWSNNETIEGSLATGSIDVMIIKYDSKSVIKEFIEQGNLSTCEYKRNGSSEEPLKTPGCGSANIGDYSWYAAGDSYDKDPNISLAMLRFGYGNYLVQVTTIDGKGKSLNETIQFAKIIRSRLN